MGDGLAAPLTTCFFTRWFWLLRRTCASNDDPLHSTPAEHAHYRDLEASL
jgi:hypothetical protein